MNKKNALIKVAGKTLWGSAFGGAIGLVPGLVTYDKKKKGKSLAKILGGAAVGATLGNVFSSPNTNNIHLPPINHGRVTESLMGKIMKGSVVGSIIGVIPGITEFWINRSLEADAKKKANKKAIKMILAGSTLGATLGGFNTGYHSAVKQIT
jgi:hypothetical protein